ncbi:MAG: hypothetical protein NTZ60_05460 [Campylobacterales bacterium]|nr:hypothetical protein [Campylobacterales bacterium]
MKILSFGWQEIYSILLKAKDFVTEIIIYNARENNMKSENQISNEHIIK